MNHLNQTIIPISEIPTIITLPNSTELKFPNFSFLPAKDIKNSVSTIKNEELNKKLEKKFRLSYLRINQAQKRENYNNYNNLYNLAISKSKSNEKILLETSPSRGPLITLASGILLYKIELLVQNHLFALEKLKRKGSFNTQEYLGAWYPKKGVINKGDLIEHRVEFLNVTELKSYLEAKLNLPVKLERFSFQLTTNAGVLISPSFGLISRLHDPSKRFSLFVGASESFFYKYENTKLIEQIQFLPSASASQSFELGTDIYSPQTMCQKNENQELLSFFYEEEEVTSFLDDNHFEWY